VWNLHAAARQTNQLRGTEFLEQLTVVYISAQRLPASKESS